MLRLALAWIHLLALGIGLAAVWARASALSAASDASPLKRAFTADAWWGIAAGLWLITGLWRFAAGTEKDTGYYMSNHVFFAKMGLFLLILALEIYPMVTLIRWRARMRRDGSSVDITVLRSSAARISTISYLQCALVIAMVLAAAAMARGYGAT
jgi:putative membrane protein